MTGAVSAGLDLARQEIEINVFHARSGLSVGELAAAGGTGIAVGAASTLFHIRLERGGPQTVPDSIPEPTRAPREHGLIDLQRVVEAGPGETMPRLPNVTEANIDPAKFDRYSMDPAKDRPDSKKSLGWADLGYDVSSPEGRSAGAQDAIGQLQAKLPDAPATYTQSTAHGEKFQVRTEIVGPNGRTGSLVTVWQYDKGQAAPRLITNWVEPHK